MRIVDVLNDGTQNKDIYTVQITDNSTTEYVDVSVKDTGLMYVMLCANGLEVYTDDPGNGVRDLTGTETNRVLNFVADSIKEKHKNVNKQEITK